MRVAANGLEFEVEIEGAATAPPVLLIMGLGMQLVAWPLMLVRMLVDAGFRVIRFDNRDIGLSSKIAAPVKNFTLQALKHRFGFAIHAPYTLREMVDDTRGLLDALAIERCHVVGVSMGGMIAQGLAAHAPERVASLASIMSTTGARNLTQPTLKTSLAVISRPPSRDRDALIAHLAKLFKLIGSPGFPTPEAELRERIALGVDRSYDPMGTLRQIVAVMASGDRSEEVRRISAPTLVLHGRNDPLVRFDHGEDTARKIRNARFEVIDGMGHDLAPGVVARITPTVIAFLRQHPI